MPIPKTSRLIGVFDSFRLDFVEREATPKSAMKLGIRLHVALISLLNTGLILDVFEIHRHRTTAHHWMHKADQQPADDRAQDQVAFDGTVIWINDEQFWRFAAVDPETSYLVQARLFSTRATMSIRIFLRELREKYQVDDATLLVDRGPWLHAALHRLGLRFRYVTHGDRNAVERVFQEVNRRTKQFSNLFSHVQPANAETWL